MITKIPFAALAATALLVGGFAPALAEINPFESSADAPGLVGFTQMASAGGNPAMSERQAAVAASVADAQRRCAAALNGGEPLETEGRCGIGS